MRFADAQFTWKQGVALTGRNRTGPPCSVGRRTGHAPGLAAADSLLARRPAALQTTPTDDSMQNNTGPLGGPVIIARVLLCFGVKTYKCFRGNGRRKVLLAERTKIIQSYW